MHLVFYPVLGSALILAVLLVWYFRHYRKKAFITSMIQAFLFGIGSSVILFIAIWMSYRLGISDLRNLKRILFFSFVTAGLSSELGKFIVLRYFVLGQISRFSPFDTILLSVNVALGFVFPALIFFNFNLFNSGLCIPVNLFSLAYIPANLLFAVLLGFFIGMAGYLKIHYVYSFTGLLTALIFNGIFNFCILTRDYKLLSLFAFGSTVIVFILALKAAFTKCEDQTSE